MYPDSCDPPNVTIGRGHVLWSAQEAARLPFYRSGASQRPATPEEIAEGWHAVKVTKRPFVALMITRETNDALLQHDIDVANQHLDVGLPKGLQLPLGPFMGLLDIVFNSGSLLGWPKLTQAVIAGDWNRAAAECYRPAVGSRRNVATKALFLSGATAAGVLS